MAGRRLGQHFLHDSEVIQAILDASNPGPGDHVLEIGPGKGVLTYPLSLSGAQVLAVEVDPELAGKLKPASNLTVVCQDFLQTDLDELLGASPRWKLVANLPYYITTPILEKLFSPHGQRIEEMWLMMQHEVAERIVSPATRQSGSLTHFVRFFAQASYLLRIPPKAFLPPPEVDSAVLHLRRLPPPPNCRPERFFKLVRTAFAQRRKMLRTSLKGWLKEADFEAAGIASDRRPEMLHFEEFLALERSSRREVDH